MGESNPIHLMKTNCIAISLIATVLAGTALARTVPDHASADLVLGQPAFDESQPGSGAANLNLPAGIALDPTTGKIFVADSDNHRILRYASAASLASGAAAEAVLGQAGFNQAPAAAVTSQGMDRPGAVFVDRLGRLWVADRNNARVLRFSGASSLSNGAAADRVYGQPDFTSNQFAVTATGMINPTGVWVDSGDRLWVSDEASCRVLRFDGITQKPSGAAADGVLGQPDMTTGSQGAGATGLERPMAIAISRTGSLFVACERANRVVRFDQAASLPNGAAASAVFGQSDFNGTESGLSATQLWNPTGLAVAKDDSLWVCDQNNNRVLRFDRASTRASGAAADGVVGQPDFVTALYDITDKALYSPQGGMLVDAGGNLWVNDRSSNRVLRFPAVVSRPVLTVTSSVPKTTRARSITIQGRASDPNRLARVRYRLGDGPLKVAEGKRSWQFTQTLKMGENRIIITAEDTWGDLSERKVIKITRK